MGLRMSRSKGKRGKSKKNTPDIPLDSPLGMMLAHWDNNPCTRKKNWARMIQYYMLDWTQEEIRKDQVYWPRYGSTEHWVCQALNIYVNSREVPSTEEIEYTACWLAKTRTKIMKVSEKTPKGEESPKKSKQWDPLEAIPPLYTPAPAHPDDPGISASSATSPPCSSTASMPTTPICPPLQRPALHPESEGPYLNTQGKKALMSKSAPEDMGQPGISTFPLWVPTGGGQGGIGHVNTLLKLTEVRGFKKEPKGLLEDPIGLAEQLDQFLDPNIYTWEELNFIMKVLFSPEGRQMIRGNGVKIWERENQQGPPGENKMPMTSPQWNPNEERGQTNMSDYQNLIIKGIKEAVSRNNNIKWAFGSQQGKEETPMEWLEHLR